MSRTATRRRKAQPIDLLDPSAIANEAAERECLAALLDILDRDAAAAIAAVETLTADAFTITWGSEVFRAIAAALAKPTPKLIDVTAALQAEVARQQLEYGDAGAFLTGLAGDQSATGYGAARVAAERAAVVRELHLRRQTVLACGDTLRRCHDERPMPDELELVARRINEVADMAAGRASRQTDQRLVLKRASEIECKPINWLWPQRIVGDGLTIITGPQGVSKSLITIDAAARVTTGGRWPDSTGHAPLGSVLLFGAEDDAGKVVVPRLMAAGADLDRVHVCQGTANAEDADEPAAVVLERHIGELRAAVDSVADCRMIVFDPLPDYIAADENKSAEVRAALVPLAKLAQDKNVAVVAVLHQNKKNDLTTVQRISGSGAFAQVAPVVLAIGEYPGDAEKPSEDRRVMVVSKSNYGRRNVGQAYEIATRSNGEPGVVWLPGIITMNADQIYRQPTGGQEHESRRGEAVDTLREMLAVGEKNAAAVVEAMQDAGLKRRQIDHAANVLNVVKRKMRDGWYWRLPARDPAVEAEIQPDPAFAAWAPDAIEQFNQS